MNRRKPAKVRALRSKPVGRSLLDAVASATLGPTKASWDDRILAAAMLVSVDCDQDEALQALQQSYAFRGVESFGDVSPSFARGIANLAAERVEQRRDNEEWAKRTDALLAARKSKLRVILGGQT